MIPEMGKRRKSARRTWKKAFMRDTSVRFPLQRFTDRRIREKQSLLVGTVSLYGQTYFACRALRYSFPSIPHPVTIPFPTVFMFVLYFHLCNTRKNNKLKNSRYAPKMHGRLDPSPFLFRVLCQSNPMQTMRTPRVQDPTVSC